MVKFSSIFSIKKLLFLSTSSYFITSYGRQRLGHFCIYSRGEGQDRQITDEGFMQGFAIANPISQKNPFPFLQASSNGGVRHKLNDILNPKTSHLPLNPRPIPPSMLKLLSSSPALRTRVAAESRSPVLKPLSSLTGLTRWSSSLGRRAFFCSERSSDGSGSASDSEVKPVEVEGVEPEKASSAIVPTKPRPEDCLTVSFNWQGCIGLWLL